ncbi:hypothetical protein SRABI98_03551 [Microbacterium sp. Bi98]|uniref:hypothetical protein n=1 Tax=Microbacterium sp. Bi98 TaxID=2821116 RepID=UPI001D7675D2|nr:hypothetical protein [Microbacterium sp. Bi98]CAH0262797.1 hypothetical protein SRABI98_03551 [Microbacterium sp. Bi98]
MSTTLSYAGGTPIQPDFTVVGSGDAEIVSRTITHEILDGPPVHTMRPARPQTGTLELLFATSARAHQAKDRLTAAAVYTIVSTDSDDLPSRIIVRGLRVSQHEDAAKIWTVYVDYEAVN